MGCMASQPCREDHPFQIKTSRQKRASCYGKSSLRRISSGEAWERTDSFCQPKLDLSPFASTNSEFSIDTKPVRSLEDKFNALWIEDESWCKSPGEKPTSSDERRSPVYVTKCNCNSTIVE